MTARHIAFKHVPIKNVVVPGDYDMAKRLKADNVNTLAASLKSHGQLQPCIVVPMEDNRYMLWAGGDRYAAALLAELDKLWVSIWEADDRGALEMQLVENCHRRHSQQEQAAARQSLIELYGQDVEQEHPGLPPEKAKQEVVKRVAQAMGVQPATVERAERRRRQKAVREDVEPRRAFTRTIDTMGIEMSLEWMEWAGKYQEPFLTALDHLQRVQMNIGRGMKALGSDCPAKSAELMRLHDEVHAVLTKLKGAVPTSVCPYCKALDGAIDACAACGATGLVSDHQLKQAPKELLETGKHACIYHAGKRFTVAEWEASHGGDEEPEGEELEIEPRGQDEPTRADWGDL